MRILKYMSALFLVFAASIAQAVPVSWTYDSRIEVVKTEIDNGDGTWDYTFNITNTDTQNIWFSNIYTEGFEAYNLFSSITSWDDNAYTQLTLDGMDWNIPGLGDSWFAGFFNLSWPDFAELLVGQTAQIGFTVDGQLSDDTYYGYWVQNDYEWNRFTSVGIASLVSASEPAVMLLMGLGLVGFGIAGRRRCQKSK